MLRYIKQFIPFLLLIIVLLVVMFIPGGPIETRSFEGFSGDVFQRYISLLVALGIFSLIAMYVTYQQKRWGYILSILLGLAYILLFELSLLGLYPKSSGSMTDLVAGLGFLSVILSVVLIIFSYIAFRNAKISFYDEKF